ncbi:glutamine cyclotransferase [Sphingomonas sp. Leaf33]|uniref:glutaminyl-peptide cyclotransferase n=1 Tax=Sphingomonas sp. Leaf33 TaxID=1736215 RepID=UPI0006F85F59|nr:glutaminyl-peptide cyclotransferase [Sphingomonas sp. Leaf33]KQN25157.1 glutamine cyclotransferase [Sphingomonas sp. Leaf33]
MIARVAPLALAVLLIGAAPPQAQPTPPQPQAAPTPAAIPLFKVAVVARHPHDARAFTQGLVWHDGSLFESTGKEGRSEVRHVSLADGAVRARQAIPYPQFGEGLARYKDTLVSLTWRDGIAYRWNAKSLKPMGTRRYPGEGWGLASLGDQLVLSDGTSALRFLDPDTLAERRRVTVTVRGRPIDQLNELETVGGEIFANVWQTDYIVAIDPADGHVTRIIDAGALSREIAPNDPDAVLNGIAWDPAGKRLFVTGKLWPKLFEVTLVPATE